MDPDCGRTGYRTASAAAGRGALAVPSVFLDRTCVRPDAFTEEFPAERFAEVLFSLMLSALLRQDYDPGAALEIVRRTVY